MKVTLRLFMALATFSAAGMLWAQAPAAAPANPLEKLAWLEGKWTVNATVPGSSDSMLRESFFEWTPNKRALRFWSFVTPPSGQRRPYVDGWYIWDPVDKKIRFAYVDPGGFYEGEVRAEGNVLDHVFTGKTSSGVSRWRYTFTNNGDGAMPTVIYSDKAGQWAEFVNLTYKKEK